MSGNLLFIFLFCALIQLSGCYIGKGVFHTVKSNETLWRICKTYGVSVQEVAEINNIRDPREIEKGSRIFIPGASRVRKVRPYAPVEAIGQRERPDKKAGSRQRAATPVEEEESDKIVMEKDRFSWPVKGEVISRFGMRGGVRHDGIDIKAKEGTAIKAAGDGEVVYVNSSMRGYGNIVIVKHKDEFYTVYAHNRENLVNSGDSVVKGADIGRVGNTGNASVSHLHFEVRQGKRVRNPLFFLP